MCSESDAVTHGHIQYEILAREALRHVVRAVLEQAQREGLPGDHHFYITFRTDAPGVGISDQLRAEFPQEMTIVLQHQFWDLDVTPERFSVKLAFGGVPRELVVPFSAVSAFFDPSVQFGLQFAPLAAEEESGDVDPDTGGATSPATGEGDSAKAADGSPPDDGGEVVSLDAFRKK